MLFFVEGKVFVSFPCLPLTILVKVLQLFFYFCGLLGYMIGTKKTLVNIEVHCLTILHCFSLFA